MNDEWDSYNEENDPTYKKESTVFSRLPPEHEAYKPHKCTGYNSKAEHDYSLSYRPNGMAENSKFIKEIAIADIDKTKLPHNVGKYNGEGVWSQISPQHRPRVTITLIKTPLANNLLVFVQERVDTVVESNLSNDGGGLTWNMRTV